MFLIMVSKLRVSRTRPEVISHTLTVLSKEAEASSLPSSEKATAFTVEVWPLRVCWIRPKVMSHSLTVLSEEAKATNLVLGEKATPVTSFSESL